MIKSILFNYLRILFKKTLLNDTVNSVEMETSRSEELKRLFDHLMDAKKHASNLRIFSITKSINSLIDNEIFTDLINKKRKIYDCATSAVASKKMKHDFNYDDDYVVVYTDGACENNGKSNAKAGIGVWFGNNHPCNISKPVNGKATNNVAEIQACIAAIETAKEHKIEKIKIITDSQFTINAMTKWISKWKRNGWKLTGNNGDVKNKNDFVELDKLCQTINVKWEHCAGHKGIIGNEEADRLAREGAKHYTSS